MNGVAKADIHKQHYSYYLLLGTAGTAFDGEVKAIKLALVHLDARCSLFN